MLLRAADAARWCRRCCSFITARSLLQYSNVSAVTAAQVRAPACAGGVSAPSPGAAAPAAAAAAVSAQGQHAAPPLLRAPLLPPPLDTLDTFVTVAPWERSRAASLLPPLVHAPLPAADPFFRFSALEHISTALAAAAAAAAAGGAPGPEAFLPQRSWVGSRPGYFFSTGDKGTGYYADAGALRPCVASAHITAAAAAAAAACGSGAGATSAAGAAAKLASAPHHGPATTLATAAPARAALTGGSLTSATGAGGRVLQAPAPTAGGADAAAGGGAFHQAHASSSAAAPPAPPCAPSALAGGRDDGFTGGVTGACCNAALPWHAKSSLGPLLPRCGIRRAPICPCCCTHRSPRHPHEPLPRACWRSWRRRQQRRRCWRCAPGAHPRIGMHGACCAVHDCYH
jgi:hypothetical protein